MSVQTMDVNTLVAKLSSFGTYQKRNFFLISLAVIFSATIYSYIFTTRNSKYRCFIEECDNEVGGPVNESYEAFWLYNAIPSDDSRLSKCSRFAPLSEESKACNLESFNKSEIIKCDKFVFETPYATIEQDFGLTCEENLWKLTILGSLNEFSEVFYLPTLGVLSDRYGRRTMLIISLVLSGLFGTIKSFATNYIFFAAMELVTACFTSGIYSAGFILGVELLVAEQRVMGSTIIALAFPIGEILLGLAAWFTPSWRFMLRVLYAPGLLFVAYFWFMDESIRFLITNGHHKKAEGVIKRIAKVNGIDLHEDIKIRQPEEKSNNGNENDNENLMQVFRYPRLLLRILNCSFSWISCTFVYYGLTIYSVSLTGNLYLNFIIMAFIEIPAYIICYFTLDKFGRRASLAGSLLISGIACFAFIFAPEDSTILQLLLPIVGKFAATMAFKTIYIYTAEMFPTTLRHSLLAVCSMFGRMGSIAAPQIPLLTTIMPSIPLIIFSLLGVSAGILALFLPETRGEQLPDTIKAAIAIGKKENYNETNLKL